MVSEESLVSVHICSLMFPGNKYKQIYWHQRSQSHIPSFFFCFGTKASACDQKVSISFCIKLRIFCYSVLIHFTAELRLFFFYAQSYFISCWILKYCGVLSRVSRFQALTQSVMIFLQLKIIPVAAAITWLVLIFATISFFLKKIFLIRT